MTFWIIFTLVVAVVLILSIERLLTRLGVRPVVPEETRSGVALVAERLERWAERRNTRPPAGRGDAHPHDDEHHS